MKTTVVLTALPFLVLLLVKVGDLRWLKHQIRQTLPAHQVEHYLPQTPVEALEKTPVLPAGTVLKKERRQLSAIILTIKMLLSNLSPDCTTRKFLR